MGNQQQPPDPIQAAEDYGRRDDAERCVAVAEFYRKAGYIQAEEHQFLRFCNALLNWCDYDPRKPDWLGNPDDLTDRPFP